MPHRPNSDRVNLQEVGLEGQVVAEPLRLLVGVDVTPDPGDEPGVVQDRSFVVVESDDLAKPQRDDALAHGVFHRLAESQIGAERQHGEQLGTSHLGGRRRRR